MPRSPLRAPLSPSPNPIDTLIIPFNPHNERFRWTIEKTHLPYPSLAITGIGNVDERKDGG